MRPRPAAATLLLLLLLLLALSSSPPPASAAEKVSSQYYVCTVRGECPEVPELLKVADAAYSRFAAHFGKKPSGSGKLEIEYFAEASAMGEKMKSDGFPDEAFGSEGRFWNYNRKVYARRLDFDWDTRRALIINLVDQFQSLSVQAKNKACPTWYRAGLAAHFAVHRWDGKTLQAGVDDEPTPWGRELAKNYESARAKTLDVGDPVRGDAKSYIEAWPFVHWSLASGDKGAYARFRSAEKRMWDGESGSELNTLLLGSDPKKVREAAQEWFAGQRATWIGKLDLWERTSEDGFRSVPRPNPWSLLVTDADEGESPFIEALVAPGEKAAAGVALHAGETGSFVAAVWTPGGSLSLSRYVGPDRPEVLESCAGPEGAEARIRLEADGAGALRVSVAGKQVLAHAPADPGLLGKGKAGLFASDGPARFEDVKCSAVKGKRK